jgi:hypothetical protein
MCIALFTAVDTTKSADNKSKLKSSIIGSNPMLTALVALFEKCPELPQNNEVHLWR